MTWTPEELLRHTSGKVRERAQTLLGDVSHRSCEGQTYRARVQGSRRAPYRVQIDLQTGAVRCSCPDEYNAICKHAAATLWVLAENPESFEAAPEPRRLPRLRGWTDADVERLLERLHDLYPDTVDDWARQRVQTLEEEEWG
ncbi:hypothetical protein Dcar01_02988 [Deinococcus carri]|uniref:SWIM-type domain-containing protein n=1 Tax=Deinococcus carri TaxID=1211323 RepID=A0ABP9WCC7_9DEIO